MKGSVVALLGGLGNQLFQVAFARWLERRTEYEVRYDISFRRDLELDVCDLPEIGPEVRDRVLSRTRRWPTPSGRLPVIGRGLRRAWGPRRIVIDYTSAGPAYPSYREPAWWFGYWQRLRYAQDLVTTLRDALSINDSMGTDRPVGVHVRRRDMLTTTSSLPGDWFRSALRRLPSDITGRVCVWSDDPQWCESELDLGVPFDVAPGASAVEHLTALAGCRALVISRSTFSWWAAAIAASHGARIVFPTPWWPGSPKLEHAVVPGSWTPVPQDSGDRAADRD